MPADCDPHLSLIIPAFDEAGRLPESLRKIVEFSGHFAFMFEVLVVVEKSKDGTLELARDAIAKQANFHIIDNGVQRGKGFAVRSGMRRAKGTYIFYMDADLSVPLEEVLVFLDYFHKHPDTDVLIGNRRHSGSRILRHQTVLRRKMGQAFNKIIQSLSPIDVCDTQCGFKAFRNEAAQEIFSRQTLDGFAFDVEVLMLAIRLGLKIIDLPVSWMNSPESKVNILLDSVRMLNDSIKMRGLVERTLRENPVERRT